MQYNYGSAIHVSIHVVTIASETASKLNYGSWNSTESNYRDDKAMAPEHNITMALLQAARYNFSL